MKLLFPIILQLAGVGVILAEIFLPSGGILSIVAGGILIYSLYIVFTEISTTAGIVFLAADIITLPILIVIGLKLLAHSPASLKKELSRKDGVFSQSPEMEKLTGLKGEALTDLRPAGMARIDGSRTDVVTRGEYIEKGSPIEVIKVTGNQIVVRKQK
jgi:membrane-bound serine protease (ClpP class)